MQSGHKYSSIFFFSYIENNIRSCNFYRSYDSNIPNWLHDRPKNYVQHCIKKIQAATNLTKEGITRINENQFKVRNEYGDCYYDVNFGNESSLPSCSCHSWISSFMPCKHMLSIIDHLDEVTWETFGTVYRNSVFFNLDFEVFGSKKEVSI